MRMDKLTNQLQTALADAQSLALGKDHNFIEPVHLLRALLEQRGGASKPLLQKAGADVALLDEARLAPAGVVRPIELQQEGYAHIRP